MKYFALVVFLFGADGRDETFTFDRFASRDDCGAAIVSNLESIVADAATIAAVLESMSGRQFSDHLDARCIQEAAI